MGRLTEDRITELQHDRAALVRHAKGILDKAQGEGRATLNAVEMNEYDDVMDKVDGIKALLNDDSLEEFECAEERRARLLDRATARSRSRVNPNYGVTQTATADPPIALTREVRCADHVARFQGGRYTDDERNSFSLGRIIRAQVTGDRRRLNDTEQRALSEGTDSAGGYMVFDELGAKMIDRVRNQMRVIQAGALTVPMASDTLNIARLASAATTAWKTENAAITAGDLTFERVQLSAKTLPVLVKMSVELFEDMQPGGEQIIEQEIAQAIALELDRVALRGSGTSPEPRGIRNQTGVTVTELGAGAGSTPTSYDFLIDAISSVWSANGEPTARIYASRTAKTLAKLKDTTNQPLRAPDAVTAVKEQISNQVPVNLTVGASTDCSEAYVGDFRELLIGVRTAFRLEASRQAADSSGSAFGSMQVWLRAYLRADIALAHPALFTVVTGIRA